MKNRVEHIMSAATLAVAAFFVGSEGEVLSMGRAIGFAVATIMLVSTAYFLGRDRGRGKL